MTPNPYEQALRALAEWHATPKDQRRLRDLADLEQLLQAHHSYPRDFKENT